MGALILLALDSGCRQSEILGLHWNSVDFDRGEIYICQTLDTIGGVPVLKQATKTSTSRRRIRLSTATIRALARHHAACGRAQGYVFTDATGSPFTRSQFYRRWRTLLKAASLPAYHFHSCRHTMATRLLRQGCYLTAVSHRLGHVQPAITLNVCSSAIPQDQAPLAGAFDALVRPIGNAVAG